MNPTQAWFAQVSGYLLLAFVASLLVTSRSGRLQIGIGVLVYYLGVYNERFFPGGRSVAGIAYETLVWLALVMSLHMLGTLASWNQRDVR